MFLCSNTPSLKLVVYRKSCYHVLKNVIDLINVIDLKDLKTEQFAEIKAKENRKRAGRECRVGPR